MGYVYTSVILMVIVMAIAAFCIVKRHGAAKAPCREQSLRSERIVTTAGITQDGTSQRSGQWRRARPAPFLEETAPLLPYVSPDTTPIRPPFASPVVSPREVGADLLAAKVETAVGSPIAGVGVLSPLGLPSRADAVVTAETYPSLPHAKTMPVIGSAPVASASRRQRRWSGSTAKVEVPSAMPGTLGPASISHMSAARKLTPKAGLMSEGGQCMQEATVVDQEESSALEVPSLMPSGALGAASDMEMAYDRDGHSWAESATPRAEDASIDAAAHAPLLLGQLEAVAESRATLGSPVCDASGAVAPPAVAAPAATFASNIVPDAEPESPIPASLTLGDVKTEQSLGD